MVHAALTHTRLSSDSPKRFLRFIQVAYALPEWWVVTVYSGSICLFCFKGEPPYLFATCSVQSALKFRLPSLRLLADCLPTEFCQRLDTIYIYIYINSFISASNFLHFPSFFLCIFCFFFHPPVGRRDAAFLLQKRPISFESLSLSVFFSSHFLLYRSLQFLQRSRFSNKRPVETIYLLRPR